MKVISKIRPIQGAMGVAIIAAAVLLIGFQEMRWGLTSVGVAALFFVLSILISTVKTIRTLIRGK